MVFYHASIEKYLIQFTHEEEKWEKIPLILERLEAPGKQEVWGLGSTLAEVKGRRNGLRNCGKGELEYK